MPLTKYQAELAKLIAKNRSEDSHLAGGAALHADKKSLRYSEDLDYFHDSEERVASAFSADQKLLEKNGYVCKIEMNQPGYIRCLVSKGGHSTKVEWARDSSWRFMPAQKDKELGYVLHPMDLAINKVLALVGRDEPRDFLDAQKLKASWLRALEDAERFMDEAPPEQIGHLYFSKSRDKFVQPNFPIDEHDIRLHSGHPGGILPTLK